MNEIKKNYFSSVICKEIAHVNSKQRILICVIRSLFLLAVLLMHILPNTYGGVTVRYF